MPLLRPAIARRFCWLLLPLSLLAAAAAWAGPKEDLKALSVKFLALRSYHVTMTNSDKRVPRMEVDFVAPNRYRMQMPMGTQYMIGDVMYMTIDGRTMRVPMPKGTVSHWRETDRSFREIDKMRIEALGVETLNGKSMKKYRMTQTTGSPPTSTLLWVAPNGYPAKVETTGNAGKGASTMTIVYSRFNDPAIRIEPPK